MSTLQAIAYKTVKKGPMKPVFCANVSLLRGVENDVFGRPSKRQVTVMSIEQWKTACQEINVNLDWLTRRANLLIDGHEFSAADVGKTISIGEHVSLVITGETDPCAKMEIAQPGLEQALSPHWRGGVTCKVVTEGLIQTEDPVVIA
ncbi:MULTISPECIES: MOSC domain-containing protein [Shewanella]|uniref:MOSC domain-containing protein n=1 Tax=Shewanella TaxID=22 RepID=UPI0006D68740|nr:MULTISPECIES: MOSC domain-containing protein [Shewanella]KPZ69282.1 MOSC domain protein [Shewanella sp. P1-14-1]MBQ4892015.1 MOSC domain-containing protein [Shewanella sp. MMG014]OBT09963.1 molybdenum cofactor biosysynthesis protein [Shewanella sp. UCD-FRSSP16_17]